MKIVFHKIDIRNYKSIIKASLSYIQGVWKVEGTNNDAFGSNGAGKSTTLEALQQCLFNKTAKGTTLDTTINRKTGRAYTISTEFSIINGDLVETYKVLNDRVSMKITIYRYDGDEWVDLGIKSTPSALSHIQVLIGLDFNSFIALTHITHSTVISMTDSLSDSNLMKVLLDFGLLSRFEKRSKEVLKESINEHSKLLSRKNEIESSLALIETFIPADTTALYKELAVLNAEATELRDIVDSSVKELNNAILERTFSIKSLEKDLQAKNDLLHNPICTNCGCNILDNVNSSTKNKVQNDIIEIEKLILDGKTSLDSLNIKLTTILETDKVRLDTLQKDISNITNKIHISEYNEHIYNSNKGAIKNLKQELSNILGNIPKELVKQSVLEQAQQVFKKGVLNYKILSEFCSVLNVFLKEYLDYVSMDYISVKTEPSKGSFIYNVEDTRYSTLIQFQELSGGELTRTRLAILLAILKTIQLMTNTSINILIFDEALDTLDKSASSDLARLFHNLVDTEDKFIAMVSHGEQLNEIQFRGTINIIKTDNTTNIYQES